MGGAVAMYAEQRSPAVLFDGGAILIEPVIPNLVLKLASLVVPNPLVSRAKRRNNSWKSREEARAYFALRVRTWHEEFLDAYIAECFTDVTENNAREHGENSHTHVTKICAPAVEAAIMTHFGPLVSARKFRDARGGVWRIVAGEQTTFPPFFGGASYFRQLAVKHSAEFVLVPDAAHFVPMERPEALASVVAAHVSELTLQRRS